MKDRVCLTLERDLIAQIDKKRGLIPRSAWIEDNLKNSNSMRMDNALA